MRGHFRPLFGQVLVALAMIAAGEVSGQQKAPVPDAAGLEAAQKAAGELFGSRFRSAKTAADKAAVAAEMIEAALKLQDGLTDQYVLLEDRAGDCGGGWRGGDGAAGGRRTGETVRRASREAQGRDAAGGGPRGQGGATQGGGGSGAAVGRRLDGRQRNRAASECL